LIQWIIFEIALPLAPVFASAVVLVMFLPNAHWTLLVKDGELFIFSATISAVAVNKLMLSSVSSGTLTLYLSWIIILISIVVFAVISYLKIKVDADLAMTQDNVPRTRRVAVGDGRTEVVRKRLAYTSLCCGFLSVLCSYFTSFP
jgi:hypothetical protein